MLFIVLLTVAAGNTALQSVLPSIARAILAGREHGDRVFLVHEDERVSFGAFARATLAFSQQLAASATTDRMAAPLRSGW